MVTQSPFGERTLNILLVDDNEENRIVITSFFRNQPWSIDEVSDGLEAVNSFKKKSYDLILMDMQMPGMDGYSATREIRKIETEDGVDPTPIVALTAYALKEEVEKSFKAGCDGHLTKPIGKKALLEAIHEFSQNYEFVMEKELFEIFPAYVKNRTEEIVMLEKALAKSDLSSIEVVSHRLKGSSGSYGLHDLSELGAKMEKAAETANLELIRDLISQYKFKMGRIKKSLQKMRGLEFR